MKLAQDKNFVIVLNCNRTIKTVHRRSFTLHLKQQHVLRLRSASFSATTCLCGATGTEQRSEPAQNQD